jgi:hypothetical protein
MEDVACRGWSSGLVKRRPAIINTTNVDRLNKIQADAMALCFISALPVVIEDEAYRLAA